MAHRTPFRGTRALAPAALAAALAATLAACGIGGDSGSGSGSGSDSDGANGGATRTVDTVNGPVEVPESPERVVVLDTAELDTALTLDVVPVGAVRADVASGFLSYLPQDALSDIENVGNIAAPNLERINELDPDLILGSMVRDADRYDELSEIAPTVMAERVGGPWQENFLLHAEALGKAEEAERVVAAYQDHVAEVVDGIGGPEAAAELEVSLVRFVEGGDTRLYGRENYLGTILEDLGLGRPEIVDDAEDGFAVEISPEQLDLADGDVIFLSSYGSRADSGEAQGVSSPLWESLTAVQEGHAHRVDDELWFQGIGYTAAEQILDEMAAALAELP